MYCYHCGNKIYNKMVHCPYCENEIEDLSKMLFGNTIDELSQLCPALDETESIKFNIKGVPPITIDKKLYLCCIIRAFCQNMFMNVSEKMKTYIKNTSYDVIDRKGHAYFVDIAENIAYAVMAFCKRNYKLEEFDSWENSKYSFVLDISLLWEVVQGVKDEFASLEASIRAKQSEIRKIERTSRWIGGGSGLKGAIIGSIQADILNAAGDVATNVGKKASAALVGGFGGLQVDAERNNFKNSNLFWKKFKHQLQTYFDEIEIFLLDEFNLIIAEYAEARKLNYFSEYQDHKDMEEDVAKQRIQEKIFDANVYVSLYKHDKSRGPELYRLAKFCSIDEKVLKGFIQRGDKDFYENHLLEEIGYDTDIEKLKEIKCEIFELKANNYGYCIGIEGTEKLTKLHRKIDELIMENDAKERQNLVKETFVNNKRGGAIKKLLEMSDERIHWLLFRDMITRFKKGVEISQYKGEQYPLIIEAYWLGALYGEQRSKIIEMVKKNLRVWSPYACASLALAEENGFKGYKYKQENKAFHVWEGAKKRSAHAWWYLGLQHKNEKINTEENLQLARIYLKNANIYGIGDKRVLEILK